LFADVDRIDLAGGRDVFEQLISTEAVDPNA
jgi:hypothetical protein